MRVPLKGLVGCVLPAVTLVLAAGSARAQLAIAISKPGPSVPGTVTLELHAGAPPVPACTGIEPCPGAGPHVTVATAPVVVGPATTAAALSAALAVALTAAGAPTVAGPAGILITAVPPGTTHCCVNSGPEDGPVGHSMVLPLCTVNNIADGVALNGAAPPAAGFTFVKAPAPVPALPGWGIAGLVLLAACGGAFVLLRQRA